MALSNAEIEARLQGTRWTFRDGSIARVWKTQSWKATMMAVNAVAHLCELAWHHPTIVATYGSLEVRLDTHDAGGVTDKDFSLAKKIDAMLDWDAAADGLGAPAGEAAAAYFKG